MRKLGFLVVLFLFFSMFSGCGDDEYQDMNNFENSISGNMILDEGDEFLSAVLSVSPSSGNIPFTSTATINIMASSGETPFSVDLYKNGSLYKSTISNSSHVTFSVSLTSPGYYSFYAHVTSRNKTTDTIVRNITAHTANYRPAFPASVYLKRVRYCTRYRFGICTRSSVNYSEWENNGVSNAHQKSTYIGIVRQPAKSDIENINIYFAGQQPSGNGVINVVTGQAAGYKSGCDGTTSGCYRSIDSRGLAAKIYNAGIFDWQKTFISVVYDTKFNHLLSSGEKSDMEDAYYDWIVNKFYSNKIKTIYLAGSSRGGCLAMRLAKRFRADFPESVRVIVSSFDGVCKRSQSELGVTDYYQSNPYNTWPHSRKGWYTNLNAQFPDKTELSIYHISGGGEVVPASGVRGFSYLSHDGDLGWYRQNWVNLAHTDIGRVYTSKMHNSNTTLIDSQVNFVNSKMHPTHVYEKSERAIFLEK